MATIEVETATHECWKKCESFKIVTVCYWSEDEVYMQTFECENFSKCQKLLETLKEGGEK